MSNKVNAILEYWFGDIATNPATLQQKSQLWWQKNPDVDAHLAKHHRDDVLRAAAGEYDDWLATPEGWLALIILLDQFSRNIFRNTPQAFAQDEKALQLALNGIELGWDESLDYFQRVFCYLPLEHAEDLDIQQQCVGLFERLSAEVPDDLMETFKGFLKYAYAHEEAIDEFGRFPHRNVILERISTPEEIAYLNEPGAGF